MQHYGHQTNQRMHPLTEDHPTCTPPMYMRQQWPSLFPFQSPYQPPSYPHPEDDYMCPLPYASNNRTRAVNLKLPRSRTEDLGHLGFGVRGMGYQPQMQSPFGRGGQWGRSGRSTNKPNNTDPIDGGQHYCVLCKVSCVGKQSFNAHLSGQKHKKKANQQQCIAESYCAGIEAYSAQNSRFFSPGQHSSSSASGELHCKVCDVVCAGLIPYEAHLSGARHQRHLGITDISTGATRSFICTICNIDCQSAFVYETHLRGQKHARKQTGGPASATPSSYVCGVCNIDCGGPVPYAAHLEGSRHHRAAAMESATAEYFCAACRVDCQSAVTYGTHLMGKRHQRNHKEEDDEQTGRQQPTAAAEPLQGLDGGCRAAATSSSTGDLTCPLCNIRCTGIDNYRTHLAGKQHVRAVKLQTGLGATIPDCEAVANRAEAASASSPPKKRRAKLENPSTADEGVSDECIEELKEGRSVLFRCRICECSFSDVNAKTLHLKGKKHQSALRRLASTSTSPAATAPPPRGVRGQLTGFGEDSAARVVPQTPTAPAVAAAAAARGIMTPSTPPRFLFHGGAHTTTPAKQKMPPQWQHPQSASPMFSSSLRPYSTPASASPVIGLPPHIAADEHYMQTKLRLILPTEQEAAVGCCLHPPPHVPPPQPSSARPPPPPSGSGALGKVCCM